MKKKMVKICSKCGSTNIGPGVGGDIPGTNCYNCGYGSYQKEQINPSLKALPGYAIFPEIEESKVKSFQNSLKKRRKQAENR
jgi:hypothetical protein